MGTNARLPDAGIVAALDEALKGRLVPLSSSLPRSDRVADSQLDLDKAIKNARHQAENALAAYISEMEPYAFELLIKVLLTALAYTDIVVTKQSNDGGIDIRANLAVGGITSIKTAVQVKRTKSVGRPVVQSLRGSLSAHESGLLITSGRFTEGAELEAREATKTPIALINGPKLVDLLLEHNIGATLKTYRVYTLDSESISLDTLKRQAEDATGRDD